MGVARTLRGHGGVRLIASVESPLPREQTVLLTFTSGPYQMTGEFRLADLVKEIGFLEEYMAEDAEEWQNHFGGEEE